MICFGCRSILKLVSCYKGEWLLVKLNVGYLLYNIFYFVFVFEFEDVLFGLILRFLFFGFFINFKFEFDF